MSAPTVVLLNPSTGSLADRDFGLPHLVALGSYLRQELPVGVQILDLGYEGGELSRLWSAIDEEGPPLLIGVSCYSSYDYRRSLWLGRELRARYPGVPLVVGGYHPSILPEDFVGEGAPFDHVVVGEGERPLTELASAVLGGRRRLPAVLGPKIVEELDDLPPYDWSLLGRYLPRVSELGRRFQIHLSRGCPYRCSFCLERCKPAREWRAFSPGRALEELHRLASVIDLRAWVIDIADPLFALDPEWRRYVLDRIVTWGLVPRQFWTLTRVDEVEPQDVELYARARFALGVGLESGSRRMLAIMCKADRPEDYLAGVARFAKLARHHRLPWAANVMVGHPGEDQETIRESARYLNKLMPPDEPTPGWLSVDPFRLFPGSEVFQHQAGYEERYGARFYSPRWWQGSADPGLASELLDPSRSLTFENRRRLMQQHFGDLVRGIPARFTWTGRSVDRVFERSMAEQVRKLDPARDEDAEGRPSWLKGESAPEALPASEQTVMASDEVLAAYMRLPPELRTTPLSDAQSRAMTALALSAGQSVLIVGLRSATTAALARHLVEQHGRVLLAADDRRSATSIRRVLRRAGYPMEVAKRIPYRETELDAVLVDACMPRVPTRLLAQLRHGGRLVAAIGPMYRWQTLTLLVRRNDGRASLDLGRVRMAPLCGEEGWLR